MTVSIASNPLVKPGISLVLCLWLAATCPRAGFGAEASPVSRMAAPGWVERFDADLSVPASAAPTDAGEGIKILIRDEQVNAAEHVTYRHYAMRFLSQDGVQDHSTLSFSYNPGYETLRLHQLIVHRDGKPMDRLARQEIKILQREPNLEDQLYDGRLTATLILQDIRVGDVVEYAYSSQGSNPIFAGHFVDTFLAEWRAALPRWRERLLWPAALPPPDIQNHGVKCAPQVRRLEGGRLIEYRWEADNMPERTAESEMPSWVDACGWVQVSDFASWNEVARWAAKLFRQATPDERQPLPEDLQREADVIRALPDRPAQVIAALRYVQDNYRYLGIEIGENSHQPYPIATVCERRFGDCKDKANLLSTLLRRLGFEADPALVNTDYCQTIADWHPTPYAFDHAVVRLRLDGHAYWLDATREHQGGTLGHLFFPAYGKALIVRDDTQELADVACSGFEETGVEVTDTFCQEHYADPVAFAVHTVFHGYRADHVRGHFASASREKIQRDYLNFYARQYPKIHSLSEMEYTDDRDRNEVVINERYEVTDLWEQNKNPEAKKLYVHFQPLELKDQIDLPSTRLRTMPFGIGFPARATQTIQVRLVDPPQIKPEHVEIKDKAFAFNFASEVQREQNMLTLTYRYEALANTVEADRTPEYVTNAQRALDQLDYSISINRSFFNSQTSPARPAAVAGSGQSQERPSPPTRAAAATGKDSLFTVWLPVGFLLGYFLLLAGRGLHRRGVRTDESSSAALHRCAVCGRTELNHPELDFRVGGDGQDYCNEHSGAAVPRAAR